MISSESWMPMRKRSVRQLVDLIHMRGSLVHGSCWKPLGWPEAALHAVVGLEHVRAGNAVGEASSPVLSAVRLAHFLLQQAAAMHVLRTMLQQWCQVCNHDCMGPQLQKPHRLVCTMQCATQQACFLARSKLGWRMGC